ncbi:MAG: acetylxylan esterase [Luteitalea sp.]|nr:acetylxylan esterase [Luteitalea sp.]
MTLLFSVTSCLFASQDSGWQADPDVVEQRKHERPRALWEETDVRPYELPDSLRGSDGSIVHMSDAWPQRRMEILELFRTHMYGRRPGAPERLSFEVVDQDASAIGGAATLRRIAIESVHQGRTHQFEIILFLPNAVQGRVPVFLLINTRGPGNTDPTQQEPSGFWPVKQVIARGYGIAALQARDLAPDDPERFRDEVISLFEGEEPTHRREPDAWAALAAWGWGASRAMDYFEADSRVDASKVAVLGHSRGGKASLWAGAEDERFALVISNDSGSGGAALSRRRFGESIRVVNRFTHWFAGNFDTFEDREDELPFDQHMLIALVAPRAVYVASADEDLWADPRGEFLSLAHASSVYALWNHAPIRADDMPPLDRPLFVGPRGYHVRTGRHNLTPDDWRHFTDFADHLWR